MRRLYESWKPKPETIRLLDLANEIGSEYAEQGYTLTLRQLYYQFVARGVIPNNMESYNRIKSITSRGRMAGLLDWYHLEDRTRGPVSNSHWSSPGSIIRGAARGYGVDTWSAQDRRVEVWVEKEALAAVIQRTASRWDCTAFSCKGYVSMSAQYRAAQRIKRHIDNGQAVTILHLGDHDPSGLDMTRDNTERIQQFLAVDWAIEQGGYNEDNAYEVDWEEASWALQLGLLDRNLEPFEVRRIALNMDQIREYNPPPNPAKMTDSRVHDYIAEHGSQSWELDALAPDVLDSLIDTAISGLVDLERLEEERLREQTDRDLLMRVSDNWDRVVAGL
jgi:hypothetical protein